LNPPAKSFTDAEARFQGPFFDIVKAGLAGLFLGFGPGNGAHRSI
jgi:hypothetical protein